jgi:hypothetical protein
MSILKLSFSQILIGILAGSTVLTFLALPAKATAINEYNRAKATPTEIGQSLDLGIASLEIIVTPSNEEGRDGDGTR